MFDFLGTVGVNYITEMKNSRFMIHYIFFTDKGTFSIFWYEFENSSLPHIDKKLGYDKCDCWEVYEKGSGRDAGRSENIWDLYEYITGETNEDIITDFKIPEDFWETVKIEGDK